MKCLPLIFFFSICSLVKGQQIDSIIKTSFVSKIELDADQFIGVDEFDNIYYIKENTFYKKSDKEKTSYTNTQFGTITAVDIKNPFKIVLFYGDFNTVILLDNNLNELSNKIDFNEVLFSKNIALVSGSSDNNLWIFSSDDNKLYRYDYNRNRIVSSSAPVNFRESDFIPNRMVASYKTCWLIHENVALEYDAYSNFKKRIVLNEFQLFNWFYDSYYWVKDGELFKSNLIEGVFKITFNNSITIESFYVLNNEIYIFDDEKKVVYKTAKI
ncbi:hypothetical protein EGM88_09820 [Aureibaculum marinum]|uniref:Uncharacterized protein n=1 Tax=Aureibaculum marinum TaxID=2487930 RepID=A0A3N4NWT2_9FLAO|nr:hypothetical protein [Aureibaculum marinum]RPD96650.1 hypothetical protein EGM88_09820 [Aureibaculum marinum]